MTCAPTPRPRRSLIVHLWHGREHRLIVANFGIALDGTPANAHVTAALSALEWTIVLSTDDTRFGGGGGTVRFDADLDLDAREHRRLAQRDEDDRRRDGD